MKKSEKAGRTAVAEAVKGGTKELVVREGAAALIREKKVIKLSGTITAPGEFWDKRHLEHKLHEPKKANVIYSKDNGTIILTVNESSFFSKEITGKIKANPELEKFGINADKTYTIKDLSDFLKMRKFYFKDRDEATKIIANLQKFKASIAIEIENSNDTRGNKEELMVTKVKSNLDLGFTLKTNVFKGQPDKTFKVEIECEVRDEEIEVWLVSEELRLLEIGDTDAMFAKELKRYTEAQVVCIEQ